jgi:cytochrome c553
MTLRCLVWAGVLVAATLAMGDAGAADALAGKKKTVQCAVCHGVDGIAKNPDAPNLAGNNASYLIRQLRAFQSGARQHEQMTIIAQGLSEEDVADLAAWYSSLKVTVEMPQ